MGEGGFNNPFIVPLYEKKPSSDPYRSVFIFRFDGVAFAQGTGNP
jgi:hypothetical protein